MLTPRILAEALGCPLERAQRWAEPLDAAMALYAIDTPARQAAFLAQLAHESGGLRYLRERSSGEQYDGRADLGNARPEAIAIARAHGSTPGRWWRGHGPIQITGYDHHLACGLALGVDLANEPHLLEQPQYGAQSAGWFWTVGAGLRLSARAKAHGIRDGVNLNDIADSGDFLGLTLAINGGLNGLDDRQARFARAKAAVGTA